MLQSLFQIRVQILVIVSIAVFWLPFVAHAGSRSRHLLRRHRSEVVLSKMSPSVPMAFYPFLSTPISCQDFKGRVDRLEKIKWGFLQAGYTELYPATGLLLNYKSQLMQMRPELRTTRESTLIKELMQLRKNSSDLAHAFNHSIYQLQLNLYAHCDLSAQQVPVEDQLYCRCYETLEAFIRNGIQQLACMDLLKGESEVSIVDAEYYGSRVANLGLRIDFRDTYYGAQNDLKAIVRNAEKSS